MTKKLILLLLATLITTSCLFGCGDDAKPSDATTTAKVESTTKKDVATTEPTTAEPTTQEPTTEEPSTEYVMKGERFIVDASLKDYFMDLPIQKGDKISLNELVGEGGNDNLRGLMGHKIVEILFYKNNIDKYREFVNAHEVVGTTSYSVSYDENLIIEYNEDIKIYFYCVKEVDGSVLFDVYEVN